MTTYPEHVCRVPENRGYPGGTLICKPLSLMTGAKEKAPKKHIMTDSEKGSGRVLTYGRPVHEKR